MSFIWASQSQDTCTVSLSRSSLLLLLPGRSHHVCYSKAYFLYISLSSNRKKALIWLVCHLFPFVSFLPCPFWTAITCWCPLSECYSGPVSSSTNNNLTVKEILHWHSLNDLKNIKRPLHHPKLTSGAGIWNLSGDLIWWLPVPELSPAVGLPQASGCFTVYHWYKDCFVSLLFLTAPMSQSAVPHGKVFIFWLSLLC